ncbi:hypothetical protein PA598K_05780 [Paenibacillus sp. 598K]|uniref:hypothetical protein n=1 Tax=Paenibacillus sp. 598K TaxID=1117987 RepID=UPI000FF931B8|nr:hypothetical protein [Paenibacillus sp. 598K]GBF77244.1 hypothetical protein PA598K_05780 [Paenibacillus sp. 598K]
METNKSDSETERVTGMLKWTFAAVMILGLSTISPAAQAPVFLYDNPVLALEVMETDTAIAPYASTVSPSDIPEDGYGPSDDAEVKSPEREAALTPEAAAPEESDRASLHPGVSAPEAFQTGASEPEASEPEASEPEAPAPEVRFETINGVAMDGDLSDVLAALGEPTERTTDELLGTEEVHYPKLTVGLYEGLVDYVVVPASAGSVRLGDTEALLALAQLRELLGEPDHVADDGLVYVRGPLALKLFTDEGGSALSTLEVYWAASS